MAETLPTHSSDEPPNDGRQAQPAGGTARALIDDMARRGAHPAVMAFGADGFDVTSYGALGRETRALAGALAAMGLGEGAVAVLWAPNSARWIAARLALEAAGVVPAPVDDVLSDKEAAGFIGNARPRLVVTSVAHLDAVKVLWKTGSFRILVLDDRNAQDRSDKNILHYADLLDAPEKPLPPADPHDPSVMIYTSGTTGAPKAFTLTAANIHVNVSTVIEAGVVSAQDRCLMPLPLHHVYPYMGLLVALNAGLTVVFPETATGPAIAHALKSAPATAMVGVPRLYEALVAGIEGKLAAKSKAALGAFRKLRAICIAAQRRFGIKPGKILFRPLVGQFAPELKTVFCGGAKLADDAAWTLEAFGWDVLNGYGLAETASVFTANLPGRSRIGSNGKVMTQQGRLRIAAPDADGVGEIELSGPSVFSGYRTPKSLNAETFTPDGWFKTGDRGRVDQEGYVYITGRIKEMIVLGGGENIYPEALEKSYGASRFIAELAVLERGGGLAALVRPDIDAIRAETPGRIEDVIRIALGEAARGLAPFQRLAGFAITRAELPRTRLGKFQRFKIAGAYEAALAGDDGAGTPPESEAEPASAEDKNLVAASPGKTIWALLQEKYPGRALSLDDHPELDLGMDSLGRVTFALELQERLKQPVPEEILSSAATLRALIEGIAAAGAAPETADTTQEHAEEVVMPRGGVARALARSVHWTNRRAMSLMFRLKTERADQVPENTACVVVANHASDLDPAALYAALDWRCAHNLRWSGDRTRAFSTPFRRAVGRILGIFPVDERKPAAALAAAGRVLDADHALAWFPESWRSPDGELQPLQPGIAALLAEHDVPVVPVWISGTFEAWPRDKSWPRPAPVAVRFGAPVSAAELIKAGRGKTRQAKLLDGLAKTLKALARN